MLKKHNQAVALLSAVPVFIGMTCLAAEPAVEETEKPFISGTFTLAADTHFISYGQDIWGAGTDWDDILFHPSLELKMDLGSGFYGVVGTWWDVNDNADTAPGGIGNSVQEVDVWVGLGYTYKDFTFQLTYQEWMYASQSERILDFKIAYAHFLNPSLTIHGRVDENIPNAALPGSSGDFKDGASFVLGIAPGKTLGPVSFSFPVTVSFDTDGMHAGDSGFAYATAGVGASYPLTFIPKGNWTLTAGVTYYHTEEDVIPTNPDDDFLTGSLGLTLAF